MRIRIALWAVVAFLTCCSTPRYSYYFDHQNYNAAKQVKVEEGNSVVALDVEPSQMMASIDNRIVVPPPLLDKRITGVKRIERMPGGQQQVVKLAQWKKGIKTSLIGASRVSPKTQATGSLDYDLKMAAIFVVVALAGLAIGGNAFQIIGGISLLIGVVFLIKWLIRQ